MSTPDDDRLAAEQRARVLIDRQLEAAGWAVQDKKDLNLFASQGVAVREVHMKAGHVRAARYPTSPQARRMRCATSPRGR